MQLPHSRRFADLLNTDKQRQDHSFVLPDKALATIPEPFRKTSNNSSDPQE
jgi:hypothetical protein